MRKPGRKGFVLLIVAMMALSVVAPVIASPSDDLNFDGDNHAPDPMFDDDITVAKHPMDQGTSHDAMAGYENDDGDWVSDPVFTVNTTSSVSSGDNVNPYSFDPAKIEDPDFGEFPRTSDEEGDNAASALDASEWSDLDGTATLSDTSIASGVDAVNIATNGSVGSADHMEVGYSNWTSDLDSDEDKRVLQIAGEVNSMDSGGHVDIQLEDESGDTKDFLIEPDQSQDHNASVVYGQTSGTFTYQVKLSAVSTNGGGSWDNIESINVTADGGDADISLSWLDLVHKGKHTLGKKKVDTAVDSDSDYDQTNTTYNATGTISTYSIDTLDSAFDDAELTDVTFPAHFPASELGGSEGEEGTYMLEWDDADQYPSFDHVLNVSYRLHLPAQIDLSYSNPDLEFEQSYPSGRYLTAGYEADVLEDSNLSDASLVDKTGSLASVDDRITMDSGGPSAGEYYVVKFEVKVTDDERNEIETTSGAAAPVQNTGGGGIWDFLTSIPGMIVSVGGLITGWKLFKG